MASLQEELNLWFVEIGPVAKKSIIDSINLFEGVIDIEDVFRGNLDNLQKAMDKKVASLGDGGLMSPKGQDLMRAFNILYVEASTRKTEQAHKPILGVNESQILNASWQPPVVPAVIAPGGNATGIANRPQRREIAQVPISPAFRVDGGEWKDAEVGGREARETALATGHEADQMWRDADRIQAQVRAAEMAENERRGREEAEAAKFRRSTYAGDSLRAAPGAAGSAAKAIGKALSNEYFDLLLMALGFGFGIYLFFAFSWIIAIPLIVGAFLIGMRPDIKGKTIWGRFFDSILKPSGEFASSTIPMSIIIFVVGFVLVSSVMSYTTITDLGFDPLQFALLALSNALLLFYLWTGVKSEKEKEKPAPVPQAAPAPTLALPSGEKLALPAGPLALPPGEEQKELPSGEKVAMLERKVAELEGRLEQKAIEAPKMESLPKSEMKMLAAEAESLKEEAKEEKKDAKRLEKEVSR